MIDRLCLLIHDEEFYAVFGIGAVRVCFVIFGLIAHAGGQAVFRAVFLLAYHFSFKYQNHMTAAAPMIGQITGRILYHPDTDITLLERFPIGCTPLSFMLGLLDRFPIDYTKWNVLYFHGTIIPQRTERLKD